MTMPDDLIPAVVAARHLHCTTKTVSNMVKTGRLAGWNPTGRRLWVRESDVLALCAPISPIGSDGEGDLPRSPREVKSAVQAALERLKANGVKPRG